MGQAHYRRELDGLRGLAVTMVVAYHAGYLPGGFLGVDVFFVLSGFLMMQVLHGKSLTWIEVRSFFWDRIVRIFPVLIIVILASLPFAWFLFSSRTMEAFGVTLFGAVFGIANYTIFGNSGYFSIVARDNPFMHLWSLSLEMQFYALIALILWFAAWLNISKRSLANILIAMLVVSLVPVVWDGMSNWKYMMLPTRLWQFLVGSLVFLLLVQKPSSTSARIHRIVYSTSFAAIILASLDAFFITGGSPWGHVLVTFAVAGVLAFPASGRSRSNPLTWRIFVGLGAVSFSLFLWHQPIFVFARAMSITEPSWQVYGLLTLASCAISLATWWVFERKSSRTRIRKLPIQAGVSIALFVFVVASFGHFLNQTKGKPDRLAPELLEADNAFRQRGNFGSRDCNTVGCLANAYPELDIAEPSKVQTWALTGDSHSAALAVAFQKQLAPRNIELLKRTLPRGKRKPQDLADHVRHLSKTGEFDGIIVAMKWADQAAGKVTTDIPWGPAIATPFLNIFGVSHAATRKRHRLQEFASVIENADKVGVPLIFLGQVAEFERSIIDLRIAQIVNPSRPLSHRVGIAEADIKAFFEPLKHLSQVAASTPNVAWLDMMQTICSEGICRFAGPEGLYYFDTNHLTNLGATKVAEGISDDLVAAMNNLKENGSN